MLSVRSAGRIVRIKPKVGRTLGLVSVPGEAGRISGWFYHAVVLDEGRVYNALTGPAGLPIREYKALFQDADAIDFSMEE